jgi:chromosome segregation ATPase
MSEKNWDKIYSSIEESVLIYLKSLFKDIEEKETEFNSLTGKVTEQTQIYLDLVENSKKITTQIHEKRNRIESDKLGLKIEREEQVRILEKLQSEQKSVQKENESLRNVFKVLESKNTDLKKEIESIEPLKRLRDSLIKEISDLRKGLLEIGDNRSLEEKKFNEVVSILEKKRDSLKVEIDKIESQIKKRQEEILPTKEQLENERRQVKQKLEDIDVLENRLRKKIAGNL